MAKLIAIHVESIHDIDPDTSWLGSYGNDYREGAIDRKALGDQNRGEVQYFYAEGETDEDRMLNYRRMEAYQRGDYQFIGIQAVATVVIAGTEQTLSSGGLWGIESDSDPAWLGDVAREQLCELVDVLVELGLPRDECESVATAASEAYEVSL